MTTLALTEKVLVDLKGVEFRIESEQQQGVPPYGLIEGKFQDLGLVIYDGVEYYASLFIPKVVEDDE